MKLYDSLNINKESEEPMYFQLYEKIKNLIENGSFKDDEKLPPIRSFAKKLGVNNITIINAYKMLEQKNYVYSKAGSGTYIRGIITNKYNNSSISNVTLMEQGYTKTDQNQINFSTSTPNPELFPVEEFKEVLNEVLIRDGGYAFGYQEPQGYYPLRESYKQYLYERGIDVLTEEVNVISGAQQGIDIISKALVNFNDTIIVESPTYSGALAAFKSRGANIIEIPILEDGIDCIELEAVLKTTNIKLIYVMTSFQNPTGISYSQDKKLQLLYLAQKYDCYILEDEYLSELRYYGESDLPIKALDGGNKVIYLKSFSKIFMPGIRLGFLITPGKISNMVLSAKHSTDISTSSLIQRAFDLYFRKRKWVPHIEKIKNIYQNRYDIIVEGLRKSYDFIHFSEPKGGIHIWAKTDIDSSILYAAAMDMGVLITPGRIFYIDDRESNYFRISYAGVQENEILSGLEMLKSAYDSIKDMNVKNILPYL
ncbi:MAG: GntR family transcriptional regulator [Clostridiales bacterium]|nr:GntR family transcriptional regulator [Clostridiales bacterium]